MMDSDTKHPDSRRSFSLEDDLEQLGDTFREIIESRRPAFSLEEEVSCLREILSHRASYQIDPSLDLGHGETRLESGLAVSPAQAALCAHEISRTAVFLRGLKKAIDDASEKTSGRPVRVLYAGCGPYALLALPQMTFFSPERVNFTLLDCHEPALESTKRLVEVFGFSAFVSGYHLGDACQYQIAQEAIPDVIVSETMNVALSNEPQVSVARHLLGQAPTAVMIPELVRIEACLADASKEFKFVSADDKGAEPDHERDRISLGTVFELSRESIAEWGALTGDRLPALSVRIPDDFEDRYEPKLLTRIRVYRDEELGDYDCSLTVPIPFPVSREIKGGEAAEFSYQLGSSPKLVCKL